MAATVYGKFYWSDWMADPSVRASSYAARGLWMDLLCIAATADPTGYVVLNGRPLTASDIARLTGGDASEVEILLDELARNGVFTRDRLGRIYSRRMVRDAKKAETARKNGKKGGNPTLYKERGNPPSDNPPDKTHIPEARNQKPAASAANVLRGQIGSLFEQHTHRMPPDTSRALVWVEQGYDPAMILAVVGECLGRNKSIQNLSYFEKRLAEAHEGRVKPRPAASALTAGKPPADPKTYTPAHMHRVAIDFYRGELRQGGPASLNPAHPDCAIPADILAEARAAVERERGAPLAPRAAA